MRTGADYRETLRSDGRQVWVLGEGRVEDVTTHPATSAMIDEYVAWYDRHRDPAWQDVLIAPDAADREPTPWAFTVPRSTDDLIGMGRSFAKTLFHSAGNITHDPAYGHLIAMGVLTAVQQRNVSEKQTADAEAYRAADRRYRAFSDILRRGRADRLSPARRPGRPGGAADRARNRFRGRAQRQGRHAHEPGLCRGRLYRRAERRADRRAPRELCRAGRGARGYHDLPQGRGARRQPVHRAADQPLRRARRDHVARQCLRPVGARLSRRTLAGADRDLAAVASPLRLARQGRVHARAGAGAGARDGVAGAPRRPSSTSSISSPRCRPRAPV